MNTEQRARELLTRIDRYWDLAYAEGKEGREHDTEAGEAQSVRHEIETLIRALSQPAHKASGASDETMQKHTFLPCDCGCGRSCCAMCGADLGFLSPPASAAVVPEGWCLVPLVPTEDMVVAGFESEPDACFSPLEAWLEYEAMTGCRQAAHRAKLCYAAMLAATPSPPVGEKGEGS